MAAFVRRGCGMFSDDFCCYKCFGHIALIAITIRIRLEPFPSRLNDGIDIGEPWVPVKFFFNLGCIGIELGGIAIATRADPAWDIHSADSFCCIQDLLDAIALDNPQVVETLVTIP